MTTNNPLQSILGEHTVYPLLTHSQEIDLAQRVAAGLSASKRISRRGLPAKQRKALRAKMQAGQAAHEALVLHNLPLVLSVAGRFRYTALDYNDLIQEGVLGLIKAADRYDPRRGTRFGTLAVWWIRQSIGRAVSNTGRTIRLPVNRGWRISRLRRALAQLIQTSPAEPKLEQVAKVAGVSPQAAAELLRDGQPVISLDAPPADETERSVMERLADATALDPENAVAQNELQQIVQAALNRLDEREAQILRLRFGLDGGEARPLRTIATEWRMSPEGVRQISERAMEHLRAMPRVKDLGVYLEEF